MSIRVPMVDLARQHAEIGAELQERFNECFAAGRFIGGPEVQSLEEETAADLGVRHAIGVNSGTDALHLALRALGVGPGDEVITSPLTFVASAGAIWQAGAKPVFADVDPLTWNLDPAAAAAAIGPRTRALMPVHLFGQPADIDAFQALAKRHGLALVEDSAQSYGATFAGTASGAFGDAGAFSFYPTKNLGGCGDGGLVVCNDDDVAERVRRLANHGVGAPQEYLEPGFNSRLDTLQAALLRVKLKHITRWNERRRKIAARYHELLEGLPLQRPFEAPGRLHVYHHYTVLVDGRDAVRAKMQARGVDTALFYPTPVHRQPAFATDPPASLPVAEDMARRCLSLPIYPGLREEEIQAVAAALAAAIKG